MLQTNGEKFTVSDIVIALLVGAEIGIISWIFLSQSTGWTFDDKIAIQIDPLDILGILITVVILFYVARRLDKTDNFRLSEANILVSYVADFKKEFEKNIREYNSAAPVDLVRLNQMFKEYQLRLKSITDLAEKHKLLEAREAHELIKSSIQQIRKYFTYTPRREASLSDLVNRVEDGRVHLSEKNIEKINWELVQIQNHIFELMIEMRRCI